MTTLLKGCQSHLHANIAFELSSKILDLEANLIN